MITIPAHTQRRNFDSWKDLEDYETDEGEDILEGTIVVAGQAWEISLES